MVETHATVPKWRGGNDRNSNAADSAVFILRNPVNSAIAEWNRRSVQLIQFDHFLRETCILCCPQEAV